jgi:Ser/Thr protein kinase RdoA (MazF antagonist)
VSETFETDAVREAAAVAVDGATRVTDVAPIETGSAATFALSVDGRPAVLKVDVAGEGPPVEPAVCRLVGRETPVPVPAVLGEGIDGPLDNPHFVTTRARGETGVPPADLSADRFVRLCREAGGHLAALHDCRTFDGCGRLERDGDDLVAEGATWPETFERLARYNAEGLADTRFADLAESVEARLLSTADALRGDDPPAVLVHNDYRPENVAVDRSDEGPVVESVLDWGARLVATPSFELVTTETLLIERPWLDETLRRRARRALYGGYDAARSAAPADPRPDVTGRRFRRRRREYRLVLQVRLMRHLTAGAIPPAEKEPLALTDRAEHHRVVVRQYTDADATPTLPPVELPA